MKRISVLCTLVVFFSLLQPIFAQRSSSSVKNNYNSFKKGYNGNRYFLFGGYLFGHTFYTDYTKYSNTPNGVVPWKPKDVSPNNYNGLEGGVGIPLVDHFRLKVSYYHLFEKNRPRPDLGTDLSASVDGLTVNLEYIIPVLDRWQINLEAGANVSSATTRIALNNSTFDNYADHTLVRPRVGLGIEYYISRQLALRPHLMYQFSGDDRSTNGLIGVFVGLNYYFN